MAKAEKITALALLTICSVLIFTGLDNAYFWDDESYTAIVARNLLKTGQFTGWDGRNLMAMRNGMLLDSNFSTREPPIQHLIAAAGFGMFGESTWAGRAPFAFAGVLTLIVLGLYVRKESEPDRALWLYAIAMLGLSIVFLLNTRQCRYNGPAMLLGVLILLCYSRALSTRYWRDFLAIALAAATLFMLNPLLAAALLPAVAVMHLAFNLKAFTGLDWFKALVTTAVFFVIAVPFAIYFEIWHRPDIALEASLPAYQHYPYLLWLNLRELNTLNVLPWSIAIAAIVLIVRHFHRHRHARLMAQWLTVIVLYMVFLSLLSPQNSRLTAAADARYHMPVLPLAAAVVAGVLWFIHRWQPAAAIALGTVIITSSVLSMTPWNSNPWSSKHHWHLPAYIGEIVRPYPTATELVVQYLRKRAKPDDTVMTVPEFYSYPLIFYVGNHVRLVGMVGSDTTLPKDKLRELGHPLVGEVFPKWIVSYGAQETIPGFLELFRRSHLVHGREQRYDYVIAHTVDAYWEQTQRPELYMRHFGPRTNFNREVESVFILRRVDVAPSTTPGPGTPQ